ncbi:hypothetical protein OEA41_004788 [Lepraria neglecta]|uniref:Aldehyde dehydrogenase n=1 Tax=Lepraria neglecta TaxID=209136 RepID=A0AAE0DG32_9LECA|nr:hypothetical protein OEA41_004788 [Lepraria neglecta]
MAPYTTPEQLDAAYTTLQQTFKSGKTKSIAWRKWQLKQMFWLIADNEEAVVKALHADLNRHDFESYYADIGALKKDVLAHLKNIEQWAADEIPDAGFLFKTLGGARIRKEPLGVALVLGTWNFPFIVTLSPLIAAISAGCCGIVKPAETTVACQDLMAELIPKYLDQEAIQVVTGGPEETTMMLERRFDHIFYTGSPRIAKIISAAAAKHLTPTVLELGGQAPCIVTPSADIDVAAKRIVFSKYLNGGQICLAANHVFVDPSVHDKFVERATYWLGQYLKDDGKDHAVRIVNERNYDRLVGLLNQTGGNIAYGGKTDREDKFIQQTIVTNLTMQDSLMSEEIFGPLLPVMKMSYQDACTTTQNLEHPLGLYIFSTSQPEIDYILSHTLSGGVTINDIMMHAGVANAPFGGVGNSGRGAYHGKYGFEAFTHRRTVVNIPSWFEYLLGFRYPPYGKEHISKVTVGNPPFKKGEGMADQSVGRSTQDVVKGLMGMTVKWTLLALVLAMVDARMGGRPKLLEVLREGMDGVRGRLPL